MTTGHAVAILRHTRDGRALSREEAARRVDVAPTVLAALAALEAETCESGPWLAGALLSALASSPRDQAVVHLTLLAAGVVRS